MKKLLFLSAFIAALFSACYYNNLTEIYPGNDLTIGCDSNVANITFQKTIQPILAANCGTNNSCHNSSSSNPHLDNYEGVKMI